MKGEHALHRREALGGACKFMQPRRILSRCALHRSWLLRSRFCVLCSLVSIDGRRRILLVCLRSQRGSQWLGAHQLPGAH